MSEMIDGFLLQLAVDWPYVDFRLGRRGESWTAGVMCTGRKGYYGKGLDCEGPTPGEAMQRLIDGFTVVPLVPLPKEGA